MLLRIKFDGAAFGPFRSSICNKEIILLQLFPIPFVASFLTVPSLQFLSYGVKKNKFPADVQDVVLYY